MDNHMSRNTKVFFTKLISIGGDEPRTTIVMMIVARNHNPYKISITSGPFIVVVGGSLSDRCQCVYGISLGHVCHDKEDNSYRNHANCEFVDFDKDYRSNHVSLFVTVSTTSKVSIGFLFQIGKAVRSPWAAKWGAGHHTRKGNMSPEISVSFPMLGRRHQ